MHSLGVSEFLGPKYPGPQETGEGRLDFRQLKTNTTRPSRGKWTDSEPTTSRSLSVLSEMRLLSSLQHSWTDFHGPWSVTLVVRFLREVCRTSLGGSESLRLWEVRGTPIYK